MSSSAHETADGTGQRALSSRDSVSAGALRVLVVDDEVLFAKAVAKRLGRAGHECQVAVNLAQAREALNALAPDLILLDLRLPDGNGLDFLAQLELRTSDRATAVIVSTAYGELSDAVEAMRRGASDYLKKPIDLDELILAVDKVMATAQLQHRLDYSRSRDSHALEGVQLIGESAAMQRVREQIQRLAQFAAEENTPAPTVLILGETGTGKDVAARLLHLWSAARERPFVQVDCASLPRELIEAELFGHEKGAFTSAHSARIGLLEAAENGTVFLDEIGELPLELQAKLLNVIERRQLRRIGSTRERPVSARFVAGTNRDLAKAIEQGGFRADLYYRLNVVSIHLPPLRERGEDSVLLARHYAAQTAHRYRLQAPSFEPDALDTIKGYSWPGNIRELKNLVERAVLLCDGRAIRASDLALSPSARNAEGGAIQPFGMTLDGAEKMLIEHALQVTHGNVSEAARRLGVSRMAMRYRMEKHGLKGGNE